MNMKRIYWYKLVQCYVQWCNTTLSYWERLGRRGGGGGVANTSIVIGKVKEGR